MRHALDGDEDDLDVSTKAFVNTALALRNSVGEDEPDASHLSVVRENGAERAQPDGG